MTVDDKVPEKILWHEYAKNETEFPEMWHSPECGIFFDSEYVGDWFKRCIEEAPLPMFETITEQGVTYQVKRSYPPEFWEDWFSKWFSQFKEDKP